MLFEKNDIVDRSKCLWGIDASAYQWNIDWTKLHLAGCAFAYLKCVEGVVNADKRFGAHLDGYIDYLSWCNDHDEMPMKIGLYAYVHPDSDLDDARDEAHSMVTKWVTMKDLIEKEIARIREEDHVKSVPHFYIDQMILPCAMDMENWPSKLTGQPLKFWIMEYTDVIEKKTRMSVVNYTNASYFDAVNLRGFYNGHPLWIAYYDRAIDMKTDLAPSKQKQPKPRLPHGAHGWWFWQTDAHAVDGVTDINGYAARCDVNFFNGTEIEKFIYLMRLDYLP